MKIHRAITLVLMMVLALGALALVGAGAATRLDEHGLIALAVVVVAAAVGGIGFSWKRYYRR